MYELICWPECNSFHPCFECCFLVYFQVFYSNLWVLNWIEIWIDLAYPKMSLTHKFYITFGAMHPCTISYKIKKIFSLHLQLVIQGLHMVSSTQCPAWSDQVKQWSQSRAAALKDWCPIGHRGKNYVHPSVLGVQFWGLLSNFLWYSVGV